MRALRDFNLPKIAGDDAIVFMGLIKDLFAEVFDLMPRARDYDFEQLVARASRSRRTTTRFPPSLQPTDYFVQNVVDLQDLFGLRHCVFAIGLSGNNKSQTWKTLAKCWTRGAGGENPAGIGKTTWKDINPKAITPNELYGYINLATREWKDGMLSSTMRDMANAADSNPKWIILDGDLDANWIENMNSVMDDNRLLTLASNERIRLLSNMKMIFEIRDLAFASPATVTRAGVLFISDDNQWKNYVQAWIDDWAANLNAAAPVEGEDAQGSEDEGRGALREVRAARAARDRLSSTSTSCRCSTLAWCSHHQLPAGPVDHREPRHQGREALEIYFVFACVWGFGGPMSITSRH